jgi:hypothetical protein
MPPPPLLINRQTQRRRRRPSWTLGLRTEPRIESEVRQAVIACYFLRIALRNKKLVQNNKWTYNKIQLKGSN